jgi:purine-binding chemotaxis protein CheW
MSHHDPPPRRKKRIDWNDVRQRLDDARAAIERISAPEPDEVRRVLTARARALAREPKQVQATDERQLVEFLLAHETYAVESRHVKGVHRLENLTPVPCTPAFVLGIINLRGEILSVIDMRRFFDLPEKGLTDLNKVIILHSDSMSFGILADAVLGAGRVPLAEIQPSLPTLTGIREKYLKGVTGERTVILDAEKLLADETIIVQETVET